MAAVCHLQRLKMRGRELGGLLRSTLPLASRRLLSTLVTTANVCCLQGLGEMMPEQLWATTLNPATRTLRKLTIEDAGKPGAAKINQLSSCLGLLSCFKPVLVTCAALCMTVLVTWCRACRACGARRAVHRCFPSLLALLPTLLTLLRPVLQLRHPTCLRC